MNDLIDNSRAPLSYVFFFFQAEDGIRDLTVTGVQTCALPISKRAGAPKWSHDSASARAYALPPSSVPVRRDSRSAHDAERREPRPVQLLRREALPVHPLRGVRRRDDPARGPATREPGHLSGMRGAKSVAAHLRPVPLPLPGSRGRGGAPNREPGDEAADGRGSCGPSKATNQWRVRPGLPRPPAEGPRARSAPGPGPDRPRGRCALEDLPGI